jgi:hypothetical protein
VLYIDLLVFRLVQLLFQYVRRPCARRGLSFTNLFVVFPLTCATTVVGIVLYVMYSKHIKTSSAKWNVIVWLLFSVLYEVGFLMLVLQTLRLRRNANAQISAEQIQQLLAGFQAANDYGMPAVSGMSNRAINQLPTRQPRPAELGENCSICLCSFESDDTIRDIQCGHLFHADCLDQWASLKNSCPNCIRPLVGATAQSPLLHSSLQQQEPLQPPQQLQSDSIV